MRHAETLLPLQLKDLKLAAFNLHWQDSADIATAEHWTYSQYLSHLCHLEMDKRASNRLTRRIKGSLLTRGKTLSSFDFTALPGLNSAQISALAESDSWVKNAHNLIILGPSGVGKSHLAMAIAYRQVECGTQVRFYETTTLVQQLQQAKLQLRLKDFLMKLDRIPLLILDDIGYVKKNEHETSVLFELICHRYETGSLIITANEPFSQWDSIFPDSVMTVAAIDRLVHHAVVINISGESYRLKSKNIPTK